MEWKFYKGRKRIDVKRWLQARGLKTYQEMVSHLKGIGVNPPSESEVSCFFIAKKPNKSPEPPEEIKEPLDEPETFPEKPKSKTKTKRSKKVTKKDDDTKSE
jgi:hypothetical protein